ncbi:hypothetical protein D5R81_12510 [Parashewanella spongiae]|uniref:Uncharacterized protein n=1 Tax=Parashewanella spongiae TaxID=342950 RepID=A0A3A6TK39_9GAMM|nr:hypothetical protein [Parashewanella spongiae]MCL1078705.1 hypothetical protein [Parashewanella spongiae]RJY12276.1 hypothetical protein D5R81_12510 [Parashewanella spongiae]
MTKIIQLKVSTISVDETLDCWRVKHLSLSPKLTQFLSSFPEAAIHLKAFAYYLSGSIRIFDESLFSICLTQAIKSYKDLNEQENEFESFFEILTYIAADLLHSIKIEDQQGYEWRISDGIYFTDWFVANPLRLRQQELGQISIKLFHSEKQTVRRAQQMLKNKMWLVVATI